MEKKRCKMNHIYEADTLIWRYIYKQWRNKMKEFKVGDKVIIKEPNDFAGMECKIEKIEGNFAGCTKIMFELECNFLINLKYLEHVEPKRKLKFGDHVIYLPLKHDKDKRIFSRYDSDGECYYDNLTKSYFSCVAKEEELMLKSEWEAQKKPKVGDEVVITGKIVKMDDSHLPYMVHIKNSPSGAVWVREVKNDPI